ncbi:hypothetical protein BGZ72_005881, partial [Mortierella alpina]
HFLSKATSGIKTVAAIFHQLYEDNALSQTFVEQQMSAIINEQTRILREVRALQQMLSTARLDDNDMISVSETLSRQLRVLTEFTTGVTTTLNHTVVKDAIQQRIAIILNEKA